MVFHVFKMITGENAQEGHFPHFYRFIYTRLIFNMFIWIGLRQNVFYGFAVKYLIPFQKFIFQFGFQIVYLDLVFGVYVFQLFISFFFQCKIVGKWSFGWRGTLVNNVHFIYKIYYNS